MSEKFEKLIAKFSETKGKNDFIESLDKLSNDKKEEVVDVVYDLIFNSESISVEINDILNFFKANGDIFSAKYETNLSNVSEVLENNKSQFINKKNIILNITGSSKLTLQNVIEIVSSIDLPDDTLLIFGFGYDDNIQDDSVIVSVLAR